ncbi:MAG: hypothetical protein WAN11_20485 [Syntrophobacteraceae bacterium]
MSRKKLINEICREADPSPAGSHSLRVCSDICLFFLGESSKIPAKGLCSNPNYIKSHEACLSAMGVECDYCTTYDSAPEDSRHIAFDYTGQENRQSSRDLVYNTMQLGIEKENGIVEYTSIILDISLKGIGCIVPVIMKLLPQEFYLLKNFSEDNIIKLICQTRRVTVHSNVTEIGATFKERISKEIMTSLSKI